MVAKGRAKLIDFGVSVSLGHRPHAVTGTVGFLSPEQVATEPLDEATDMFSLGLTFAVIFGGHSLRQDAADLKSRQFHSEARFHLTSVEQPTVPEVPELAEFPEIAQLIIDCTVPRRDKRLGSTGLFLKRLEPAAAARGIRLSVPQA
jgi:serine/threonine protein kinase